MPDNPSRTKIDIAAGTIAILAIAIAAVTRIGGIFRYTDFFGDEARDALRVLAMHAGSWPTLGPETQVGWQLPPLYYYLIFPATLFGPHPLLQALPNAVLSVLAVALLMLLVYRLLEGVNEERRRIIASVCGLWWSVLFADLFLNNREWNPSSIPFFMLCFVLLLTEQHRQPRLAVKAGIWVAIGICLAILESLHGSTLLVMPVVFLGVTAFDISRCARDPRRWIAPFVSLLTMGLCLTPYWAGEATRGWANSRAFVSSIFAHGSAAPTVLIRLNTVRAAWTSMSEQVFFVDGGPWLKLAGISVLVALPIFAVLLRFRGDRRLLAILVFLWAVYLYASSNYYPNPNYIHYKLPLLLVPIVLTAFIAARFDGSWRGRTGVALLAGWIAISLFLNARLDADYLVSKAGAERVMTVDDMVAALQSLPAGSTVFQEPDKYNDELSLEYLGTGVVHRGLRFVASPQVGEFVIQPRYDYRHSSRENYETSDFHLRPLEPITSPLLSHVLQPFAEAPAYRIYVLK